jgi:hypothetical protein
MRRRSRLLDVLFAVWATASLGCDPTCDTPNVDAGSDLREASVNDVEASVNVTEASVDGREASVNDASDSSADLSGSQVPPVFHVPGTQFGDVAPNALWSPTYCSACHSTGAYGPYDGWQGSLMANAGRDPLFFAQLTTANQDAPGVGYYCQRCHVPVSAITGHAYDPSGHSLSSADLEGVTCHFCHRLVDPGGQTPVRDDDWTIASLAGRPPAYGNAMFVLDPNNLVRGPYPEGSPAHDAVFSEFFRGSDLCGTCHDVGNVTLSRLPDGTYTLNSGTAPAPVGDPRGQFPLERTYGEWKASAFSAGPVDAGGSFGGLQTQVSTCEDCHMPRIAAQGCNFDTVNARPDLAIHEFAGAADWVLAMIEASADGGPPDAGVPASDDGTSDAGAPLERGRANARSMLSRAATLSVKQTGSALHVRVTNESGHKLPTGHIEGRSVFVSVRMFDATGNTVGEFGHLDPATGEVDQNGTMVFEMKVGLSAQAAARTGLPAGVTTHMSLADTIVLDSRIPPSGFTNAALVAAGAPVVGAFYPDGQNWAEMNYAIPAAAVRATVTLYYQAVTPEYIQALRDGNRTDDRGQTLYNLWQSLDHTASVVMAASNLELTPR